MHGHFSEAAAATSDSATPFYYREYCSSGSDDSAELVVPYHATPPVMILAGSGRIPDELSVRSAAYTEHADTGEEAGKKLIKTGVACMHYSIARRNNRVRTILACRVMILACRILMILSFYPKSVVIGDVMAVPGAAPAPVDTVLRAVSLASRTVAPDPHPSAALLPAAPYCQTHSLYGSSNPRRCLELSQRPSPSAPEFLWVIKETLRRQGPDANAERDAAVSTPPHTTGANNNPPTEEAAVKSRRAGERSMWICRNFIAEKGRKLFSKLRKLVQPFIPLFLAISVIVGVSAICLIIVNYDNMTFVTSLRFCALFYTLLSVIFIFCLAGQELTDETGRIFDSLAACPWYLWNPKNKLAMLIFMGNSVKPVSQSTMKSFAALLLFVLAFTAAACYLHPHVPGRRTSDLDQQQIFQSLSDFFGELSIEAGAAAPGGRR
ncbi:hypothetical protein GEV33_010827 [Tenebrio molitor]|uniref:Odorant receptor n=1 Tax=Tenebrio molitor TaxID=7067 RepID=A0A8J6HCZ4_TENMO|nr:hypothetical protein GEV33_010827 [Tenebrio molitor]